MRFADQSIHPIHVLALALVACQSSEQDAESDKRRDQIYSQELDLSVSDTIGYTAGAQDGEPCVVGLGRCEAEGTLEVTISGSVICNATSGPPELETCGDAEDEDCDGSVDEGFEMLGEPCTPAAGPRASGRFECVGDRTSLTCVAQEFAQGDLTCDGVDDDGDGFVDEDVTRQIVACPEGSCSPEGYALCVQGVMSTTCLSEPTEEISQRSDDCDGIDNDCDGFIDEDFDMTMIVCGLGVCQSDGAIICLDMRVVEYCAPAIEAMSDEVCDGEDNDCDGVVDEEVLNRCGACGAEPAEVCDGEDNDCDGVVDEGALNRCGACGAEPAEVCDGSDNDCDGRTDEGVQNRCGACGAVPVEVCDGSDNDCDGRTDEGVQNRCGACGAEPAEVCDGNDNDCDGQTDEGVLNRCGACGAEPTEVCNSRDDDCDGLIDERTGNRCGQCGPTPREVCDGRDNDCDGTIDELFVCGP